MELDRDLLSRQQTRRLIERAAQAESRTHGLRGNRLRQRTG